MDVSTRESCPTERPSHRPANGRLDRGAPHAHAMHPFGAPVTYSRTQQPACCGAALQARKRRRSSARAQWEGADVAATPSSLLRRFFRPLTPGLLTHRCKISPLPASRQMISAGLPPCHPRRPLLCHSPPRGTARAPPSSLLCPALTKQGSQRCRSSSYARSEEVARGMQRLCVRHESGEAAQQKEETQRGVEGRGSAGRDGGAGDARVYAARVE